ncbi:MAG: Gfo/Idh/MocA family oxidoreductase [Armatimonadetes bacterium]|nr:Gfo/Idh/MocA family oxidoreductase [Armatimonadota bacterium]
MLGWAIIGLGGAGTGHARRLADIPELRLVGGYDPQPAARAAFERTFGLPAADDLDALLARGDIAGVTVATSSGQHAEVALAAIAAGKHVLVEKPLGMTATEVATVLTAAQAAGVVAVPFHNRRFDPDFAVVHDCLASGRLGRLRRIHSYVGGPSPNEGWRAVRAQAGGRLYDWGPHLLDQVLSLAGTLPGTVWGVTHVLPERGDADEYFRADLRFADGLDVTVEMSGFSYLRPQRWEILGDLGTLQVTGNLHGEFRLTVGVGAGEPEILDTSAAAENARRGDGGVLIYQQLAARLERGEPLTVTCMDAWRVAAVMDAIRASDQAGAAIALELSSGTA